MENILKSGVYKYEDKDIYVSVCKHPAKYGLLVRKFNLPKIYGNYETLPNYCVAHTPHKTEIIALTFSFLRGKVRKRDIIKIFKDHEKIIC